ncbi:GNAT family N-acetyltransferase [Bradyrhizobium canariense]|uniref:GNAT family N-acetyltransferase n=1 Tax=Bradyrhizobium canariense TaxID=255045 RepID=UPI001B8A6115|nr:GNAT family N-acetyltransferase [Bradyrhizobium canariense]MBR0950729.1 GNAT family N-acetyltransferase [Bradyrhizobium canariense]
MATGQGSALRILPDDASLQLRPASPADQAFLRHLFGRVRGDTFGAAGLTGPMLDRVLDQQFRAQSSGYSTQYPDAVSLIIVRGNEAIGRLLLHCAGQRWHVIDIGLLPSDRGQGIGTKVIDAVEAAARERSAVLLTLMVLASNTAARRLYSRLGFVEDGESSPAHIEMRKHITR